jgi:DNA-binding transcriptional MocR family regulator
MPDSRNDFLNSLASREIKYNLGAGVPPIHLYPEFNPGKLFGIEAPASKDQSINYHATQGFIRETAVKVFEVNENLSLNADNVVITNGVQEAIALAIACFKNKTLACIDPSYPGFEDAAAAFGCTVLKLPIENWLKELEKLPEGSLFYLSSDFSNPTGYSLSTEERIQLSELAEKNKFYIFDDATYRPFNLDSAKATLLSLNRDYVIHALSFSKILAPGLRTAFVYLPEELKAAFIGNKSNLSLNNSGITQKIVHNWLIENNFQLSSHLDAAKERLRKNRLIIEQHGLVYNGGFFCTLSIDKKADFDFCDALLKKAQIAAIPMQLFTQRQEFEKQLRLCLANIDDDALDFVLNLIKNFVP